MELSEYRGLNFGELFFGGVGVRIFERPTKSLTTCSRMRLALPSHILIIIPTNY